MPFESQDGCEYMFNWTSEDVVHIGHFLVQGGFGQGTGSTVLARLFDRFREEGATRIEITMGGGVESEEFLREMGRRREEATVTVRSINRDGHVSATVDFHTVAYHCIWSTKIFPDTVRPATETRKQDTYASSQYAFTERCVQLCNRQQPLRHNSSAFFGGTPERWFHRRSRRYRPHV